jgi:hypothetical protein
MDNELDELMRRVKEGRSQHDPKNDFTDDELAEIQFIAEGIPFSYWLHIAKTDKEPKDFNAREMLNKIKENSNENLCSGEDLMGPEEN